MNTRVICTLVLFVSVIAVASAAGQPDWTLRAEIVGDPAGNSAFGSEAAVNDRWVVTIHDTTIPYLRVHDGATMEFLYQINADINLAYWQSLWQLEVDDNLLLVGAPQTTVNGIEAAGAVQLWDLVTGTYLGAITSPNPTAYGFFGFGLDLSSDLLIVGEPYGIGTFPGAGAAYIFDLPTRQLLHTLVPGDNSEHEDEFGWDVSIDGNRAIVGRPSGGQGGSAFLFDAFAGAELMKWDPIALEGPSGFYGERVELANGTALIYFSVWNGNGTETAVAEVYDAVDGSLDRVWQVRSWNDTPRDTWVGEAVLTDRYAFLGISPEEEGISFVEVYDLKTGLKVDRIDNPGGGRNSFGYGIAAHKNRVYVWSREELWEPGHLDMFQSRAIHLMGFGFNDKGLAGNGDRKYLGNLGAERIADTFGNLKSIYVTTDVLTFEWDANLSDPSDGDAAWAAIRDRITATVPLLLRDDTLIIYVATHGSFLDECCGKELLVDHKVDPFTGDIRSRDTNETIAMGSGHFIEDDDFRNFFDTPELAPVNKLFLTDMCFSGGLWGSTAFGDTGDLATLPKTALLAAAPEEEMGTIEDTTRLGYFTLGLIKTLEDLDRSRQPLTFSRILQRLRSINGFVRETYGNQNGDLEGILAGPYDFSDLYGILVPGDYNPVGFSTSDFIFNPDAGNGGLQTAEPRP